MSATVTALFHDPEDSEYALSSVIHDAILFEFEERDIEPPSFIFDLSNALVEALLREVGHSSATGEDFDEATSNLIAKMAADL